MADKPKRAGRPTLHDCATAEVIRRATAAELAASRGAAFRDGGAGVITITLSATAQMRVDDFRRKYGLKPTNNEPVDCYALEATQGTQV